MYSPFYSPVSPNGPSYSDTRAQRYMSWTYYLPPPGWDAPGAASSWTHATPRDPWTHQNVLAQIEDNYRGEAASMARALPRYVPPEESIHKHQTFGMADGSVVGQWLSVPSPMFARYPEDKALLTHFIAYRLAQMQRPHLGRSSIIHPAFAYDQLNETPEVIWDVTQAPSFPTLACTSAIPLYPEEYLTPPMHPPAPQMHVWLEKIPGLCFTLASARGGPLVLADVLEGVPRALAQPIAVGEYNNMRAADRRVLIAGMERRTGRKYALTAAHGLPGASGDATEFIIQDGLGADVMFRGFVPEAGNSEEWTMFTTSREMCRSVPRPERGRRSRRQRELFPDG